jgi:Rrf2 family iron-sulfur cluster assembly transcriptional regulator
VNLQKSTRYALYAAMEMARSGEGAQVTAAEVAERYAVPGTVLAKIFQQLARGGLAVSTRGTGGGYQLARESVFWPTAPPLAATSRRPARSARSSTRSTS